MIDFTTELSPAEREGLAWVDRLTSGTATEGDIAAVKAWCAASPAQAEAFARAVRLRRMLTAHKDELAPAAEAPVRPPVDLSRRWLVGGAVAAGVAGLLALHPPLDLWPSLAEFGAPYRTGRAGRKTMIVGAARIDLNASTFASGDGARLRLISGEMLVDAVNVSHMAVEAGAGRLSARNARFDLVHTDEGSCLTCVAGQIQLTHPRAPQAVMLGAGDQVRYSERQVDPVQRADLASALAWREGLLIFHDAPLSRVVADVNRYRAGHIIIANADLAGRKFNGVFKIDRIDDVVAQIRNVTGARQTRLPGGVMVLT